MMYGGVRLEGARNAPYEELGARWPRGEITPIRRTIAAALVYAAFVGLCAGSLIRVSAPLDLIAVAAPAAAASSPGVVSAALPAQLADNSSCAQLGFSDAELVAHRRVLTLPNAHGSDARENVFLPVFASRDFNSSVADARVTRAVVFLHGLDSEANTAYCKALAAASEHGAAERTLIVAPWFGDEQISLSAWSSSSDVGVSAYWRNFSWKEGADAASPPSGYTTAFDALDTLIVALNRTGRAPGGPFPNLERVVVAGFSAGAMLGVRHAFFAARQTPARYVLADASSWLYVSRD